MALYIKLPVRKEYVTPSEPAAAENIKGEKLTGYGLYCGWLPDGKVYEYTAYDGTILETSSHVKTFEELKKLESDIREYKFRYTGPIYRYVREYVPEYG
jgi:hypothetical protein